MKITEVKYPVRVDDLGHLRDSNNQWLLLSANHEADPVSGIAHNIATLMNDHWKANFMMPAPQREFPVEPTDKEWAYS